MGSLLGDVTDGLGLTKFGDAERYGNMAAGNMSALSGLSREMVDWWKSNAAPYQLDLMKKGAQLYDDASFSDSDYTTALGKASGDVGRGFAQTRDATARGLQRFGVNPNSGRFISSMRDTGISQAATDAATRNATRMGMKDTEFSRKSAALSLANGLNSPNYGMVGAGMSGLSSAANGLAGMSSSLYGSSMGMLGNLAMGAGYAYGLGKTPAATPAVAPVVKADGGEIRDEDTAIGLRRPKYMGWAQRAEGEVTGPGDAVSDSIPARLSAGEVVVPTDTVAAFGLELLTKNRDQALHILGVKYLENKIDETHTPAAEQRVRGLSVDPRGKDEEDGEAPDDEGAEGEQALADGGEASGFDWGRLGKALAIGYGNAASGGGLINGMRLADQDNAAAEERAWVESQRARLTKQQQEQDAYDTDMKGLATMTPIEGPVRPGIDASLGLRARESAQDGRPLTDAEYLSAAGGIERKYDPKSVVGGLRATQAAQVKHQNEMEVAQAKPWTGGKDYRINQVTGKYERFDAGAGTGGDGSGGGEGTKVQLLDATGNPGRWVTQSQLLDMYSKDNPESVNPDTGEAKRPEEFRAWANKIVVPEHRILTPPGVEPTDPALLDMAKKQADQWVSNKARVFGGPYGISTDATDFDRWGGDREAARAAMTQEFYRRLVAAKNGQGGPKVGERRTVNGRVWEMTDAGPVDRGPAPNQPAAPDVAAASDPVVVGLYRANGESMTRDIQTMLDGGKMTPSLAKTQMARLDKAGVQAPELRDRLDAIATDRATKQGLRRMTAAGPDRTLAEIDTLTKGRINRATAETQMKRLKAIWNDLGATNTQKLEVYDRLNTILKKG